MHSFVFEDEAAEKEKEEIEEVRFASTTGDVAVSFLFVQGWVIIENLNSM